MNLNSNNLIKIGKDLEDIQYGAKILASMMSHIRNRLRNNGKEYSPYTLEQDAKCLMDLAKVTPCFIGVKLPGGPFPTALCVSKNFEVAHTPALSKVCFKNGDIVTVDFGIKYGNMCTDMAFTVIIGNAKEVADERLVKATKLALDQAIKQCVVGKTLYDISCEIHRILFEYNLGIPMECIGHFIGQKLHEAPAIYNYAKDPYPNNITLQEGMVFCIEPIATLGSPALRLKSDGFGMASKDGSNSAHFEHMVLITNNGPKVLTSMENPDILVKDSRD